MQKVFALQVNLGAAEFFGETPRERQRSGPAGVGLQQTIKARLELRVTLRTFVFTFKFIERRHQRFWNIAAAPRTEAPGLGHKRELSRDRPLTFFQNGSSCHSVLHICLVCSAHRVYESTYLGGVLLARFRLHAG